MRRFAPPLLAQLFCISLMLAFPSSSTSQIRKPNSVPSEMQTREWALESLQHDKDSNLSRERLVAQLELRDDFRNLQIVNNDMMARRFSNAPTPQITLKEIRSSLSRIRTIAKRLSTNLALPPLETEGEELKSATLTTYNVALSPGLLLLDKSLMSFIENPMFQQLRVFDPELALRARRDLNEVVRLTDFLRQLTKENQTVAEAR